MLGVLALVLLAGKSVSAQRARGELRIEVRDPRGAAVPTEAELVSDANQFRRTFRVARMVVTWYRTLLLVSIVSV